MYISDMTLLECNLYKYAPSLLSASAIYLSNSILRRHPVWTPRLSEVMQVTEKQIKECARDIQSLFKRLEHRDYQSLFKKYAQIKYF